MKHRQWAKKRLLYPYLLCAALLLLAFMAGVDAGWASHAHVKTVPSNGLNEALRLRILAHSNTVADQWVKERVKEAVVPELDRWLAGAEDVREARRRVGQRLEDIRALADRVLQENGFAYRSQVTLGETAFPATAFLDRQFAPGRYEALLITLGDGRGDNFWCIMFPPFCFGSVADPWDTAPAGAVPAAVSDEQPLSRSEKDGHRHTEEGGQPVDDGHPAGVPELQVELRIFLLDWLRELMS